MSKLLKKILSILVILIAATLLFSVEGFTCNQLELQHEPETLELLNELFTDAAYYYYDEDTEIYTVYDSGKRDIGYAFYAEGMSCEGDASSEGGKMGFPMVVFVGLEDIYTIENIFVVSHGEDQYYWNKLIDKGFFDQFAGLKVEDACFRKTGGQVDSVTGATLSSESVLDIVREAISEKIEYIT